MLRVGALVLSQSFRKAFSFFSLSTVLTAHVINIYYYVEMSSLCTHFGEFL